MNFTMRNINILSYFKLYKNIATRSTCSFDYTSIEKLRAENEILKRQLEIIQGSSKKPRTRYKRIEIDFSQYKMRHIALKFFYLGWNYSGSARQLNNENTVAEIIIDALSSCQLIDEQNNKITLSGRTDKGVSAFQQVMSLVARSNLISGQGIIEDTGINFKERPCIQDEEIDYVSVLNRALPESIRMLAWSPVDHDFNARYNSVGRSYKYFFPKSNLSIELMEEAGKKLIGSHDYRNFCTVLIKQGITQCMRSIYNVTIKPFDELEMESDYKMYVLEISASSFIYHQIRFIVSVLLMIGQRKESIDVIDQLLDIDGVGGLGKPCYQMALDLPLVFYECSYNNINWQVSQVAANDYYKHIQKLYAQFRTKETILKFFLNELSNISSEIDPIPLISTFCTDMKLENWKHLLDRTKEETLENKLNRFNQKKSFNE